MSDCAEQYFHAWSGVFTKGNTKKLLCIWHVDRAWRKALNDHVSEKASRIEIYHQLRVLLNEREESQFIVRLQQFMSFLHDTYEDFYKYFNTHYIPITCQWATCYRVNTVVNTNMYTESFHRSLKVVYLNNKQNRRVDYWYLPMFTPAYSFLPILHLFSYVLPCLVVLTCLFVFTYFYHCLLVHV